MRKIMYIYLYICTFIVNQLYSTKNFRRWYVEQENSTRPVPIFFTNPGTFQTDILKWDGTWAVKSWHKPMWKYQEVVLLSKGSQYYSDWFSMTYNMYRRAPVGSISFPSYGTDSGSPDTRIFIHCVNGQEPMYNKLWSHGLDGLCCDVHPIAQV